MKEKVIKTKVIKENPQNFNFIFPNLMIILSFVKCSEIYINILQVKLISGEFSSNQFLHFCSNDIIKNI